MSINDNIKKDILNQYTNIAKCSGQQLTAFIKTGFIKEKIENNQYFDAFKSVAYLYCLFKTLNLFTGDEESRLQNLRDNLDALIANTLESKLNLT
jgi:hypothetical protein